MWQSWMIALARSENVKAFMQGNRSATTLAKRYVGGTNAVEAIASAEHLASKHIKSSFFYLGEYVDRQELVDENISALNCLMTMLETADVDGHVSIDPTQVGCSIDWDMGAAAFWPLAHALKQSINGRDGLHCLMIDMEDESVVGSTVELYHALRDDAYPVALTLQAYLKRTKDDLDQIIESGGKVRLVKGAFVGKSDIAYIGHEEIKRNYYRLVERMMSPNARDCGFYPIFGTHDHEIHAYVIDMARRFGWPPGSYEFEMLYGARDDVAERLAGEGESVRLYLPFGTDWWPYAVRRIGENPKNMTLLARSLL